MKKFITILTVLVPAISFAVIQTTADFTDNSVFPSFTNDDGIVKYDGNIDFAKAVDSLSNATSKVSESYYGDNVTTNDGWISNDKFQDDDIAKMLDGLSTVGKMSWIDFPLEKAGKVGYVMDNKENLEFIFDSENVYYDPNIGLDGEPLPGAIISIAIGAVVVGALRKKKE